MAWRSKMMAVVAALFLIYIMEAAVAQNYNVSWVDCVTRSTSPTVEQAMSCVNNLTNRANQGIPCCRTDTSTNCTTICTAGSASFGICREVGCTSCSNGVNALNALIFHCSAFLGGAQRVAGSLKDNNSGFFFQFG